MSKKLYKIIANFQGKDLDAEAVVGYKLAEDDNEVYEFISDERFEDETWAEYYVDDEDGDKKTEIIKNCGDIDEEYMGEFYDIKFRWEDFRLIEDHWENLLQEAYRRNPDKKSNYNKVNDFLLKIRKKYL